MSNITHLLVLTPEIALASFACIVLLVDLFFGETRQSLSYLLSQLALITVMGLVVRRLGQPVTTVFDGHLIIDPLGQLLILAMLFVTFFSFIYAYQYINRHAIRSGDYYVLGLFCVLGMMLVMSANSLLMIYLGLELFSLPLYAMVAIKRDDVLCSEAAMKYFVMGGLASGMLLYGMSIIYGVTGTINHIEIYQVYTQIPSALHLPMSLGLVFLVAGIAFKLGAAPFHMWIPDIYQGAPTPVSLFIASAPKIAALAITIRLLLQALPGMAVDWGVFITAIALISIAIGNIFALVQTNFKRLLAYSAISHMGFILLGIIAGSKQGQVASVYYAMVYALTTTAAFAVIMLLSRNGFEAESLDDLSGLNDKSPWHAALMLIIAFSLAGVPPMVGFYAKFTILYALIQTGLYSLAIYAVLFSVIGAFYYLRLIKLMYFDEPADKHPLVISSGYSAALSTNAVLILLLGIFPNMLLTFCQQAVMGHGF